MSPPNSSPSVDRNLLFGILALQMDFISRDALITAMHAWVLQKSTPLGQILLDQGALRGDTHALLQALVQKHLEMHGGDAQKSLASVSSLGSARQQLEQIADADLHQSLAHVAAHRAVQDDPLSTRPPTVGESTSAGQRFRILRPHARGGLGEVFVARDSELGREVALKEIQNRYADDQNSRSRFVLEAEITGGLEHPGIVPVYGLGKYADGRPFYAMRFIRGNSLHHAIARFHRADTPGHDARERALALRKLLGRFLDVCNAIAFAHSRGVLHRDLKPGNVMLGEYGETLVVDWGLAKPLGRVNAATGSAERPLQPSSASGTAPTEMGRAIGTPGYMPPEQAAGRLDELGPASDVYSLGATLYCLLTGKAPFQGEDIGEVLNAVQRGEFPPPRQIKRNMPAALEAVCLKAMALKPEDRYASPRALAEDIEHWLADEPVAAYPETRVDRMARWTRRHAAWVQAAVAALLLVTVISVVAVLVVNKARKDTETARANEREQSRLKQEAQEKEIEAVNLAAKRETEAKDAEAKRKESELKERQAKALEWVQRAAVAREEKFLQADALYLAKALTYSPDDHKLRAQWMQANQRALVPLETSSRRIGVVNVFYSPDSRFLVSGDLLEGNIRVLQRDNGSQVRVIPAHGPAPEAVRAAPVRGVVFRPDKPDEMISVGPDGTIRVWSLADGSQLDKYPRKGDAPNAPFLGLAIEPDPNPLPGRRIITGDLTGKVAWWKLATLEKLKEIQPHIGRVNRVRYRPDGKQLATTGGDGVVRLWDPEGTPLAELILPEYKLDNPMSDLPLAAATTAGLGAVPMAPTPLLLSAALCAQRVIPPEVYDLAYSPDGLQIAVAAEDEWVYIWDVPSQKIAWRLQVHESRDSVSRLVVTLAYTSNNHLVTGGVDGTVRAWDTRTGKQLGIRGRHDSNTFGNQQIRSLAASPDGGEIASTGADDTIRIWDSQTGKALAALEGGRIPGAQESFRNRASAYCPSKHLLITPSRFGIDAFLRSWDTRTLRVRRLYTGLPRLKDDFANADRVSALAIHPDGSQFVSSEPNGDLIWWDTETGMQLFVSRGAHKPYDAARLTRNLLRVCPIRV